MSVTIQCSRIANLSKPDEFYYGFIAHDEYGYAALFNHKNKKDFLKDFPTKQSIVDELSTFDAFSGSAYHLVEGPGMNITSIPVHVLDYECFQD